MKTGRGWWALAGIGVPTLLLALYVGAYYALVRPIPPRPAFLAPPRPVTPAYPDAINGPAVWLFHPVHWVDQKLRPHVWKRR